jgi:hypothetical protein
MADEAPPPPQPAEGGSSGGASISFAFNKSKGAAARKVLAVNVREAPEERRQIITGFQGSKAQTLPGAESEDEQQGKKVYIVPKLENTYKTGVGKFVPSFRPPDNDDAALANGTTDRFVAAEVDTRPAVTGYGLERRSRPSEGQQPEERGPRLTPAQLEQQAYKEDVLALPDAPETEVRLVASSCHMRLLWCSVVL